MYIPSHYEESRPEALHDVIVGHPLGVLVTHGGILRAHVARNNPLWQTVANGDEVLVVFRAEQAYISPDWYPTKHETGKQVPTWNYRVVHVHGRITIHDDEKYVRGVVARLTRRHEAGQPSPWKMGDAPADYIAAELKAIVGIEVEITRMVGKFKLSQPEETGDRVGAGEALIARGEVALGRAMIDANPAN
jgi:transcriptional regulator